MSQGIRCARRTLSGRAVTVENDSSDATYGASGRLGIVVEEPSRLGRGHQAFGWSGVGDENVIQGRRRSRVSRKCKVSGPTMGWRNRLFPAVRGANGVVGATMAPYG